MRVLVYGGGSVGLGISSALIKTGSDIDIIAREETISALNKKGLIRTGIFGEYFADSSQFNSYTSLVNISAEKYDYILVCTKSFDSELSAKDLSEHKKLFSGQTKIILFQNGWGNAEVFLPFFSKDRIYNARVITGFERCKPNEVKITVHADSIHIGSLFGGDLVCLENLVNSITNGDIPCEITETIEKDLWAKMLYNCALNGLGAILDVPYGVLAKHEFTKEIMNGIVDEIFKVMNAANYQTHWACKEGFLELFYDKLVPDTAEHKSSTLQDILAKKRTEINALNGAVINLSEKHGIKVPFNSFVFNIVKFIEMENPGL